MIQALSSKSQQKMLPKVDLLFEIVNHCPSNAYVGGETEAELFFANLGLSIIRR